MTRAARMASRSRTAASSLRCWALEEARSSGGWAVGGVRVVTAAGAPLLRAVRVFDVYEGEQVQAGRKSIALNLAFRSSERTLTDEDVDAARHSIVQALAANGRATLRR